MNNPHSPYEYNGRVLDEIIKPEDPWCFHYHKLLRYSMNRVTLKKFGLLDLTNFYAIMHRIY